MPSLGRSPDRLEAGDTIRLCAKSFVALWAFPPDARFAASLNVVGAVVFGQVALVAISNHTRRHLNAPTFALARSPFDNPSNEEGNLWAPLIPNADDVVGRVVPAGLGHDARSCRVTRDHSVAIWKQELAIQFVRGDVEYEVTFGFLLTVVTGHAASGLERSDDIEFKVGKGLKAKRHAARPVRPTNGAVHARGDVATSATLSRGLVAGQREAEVAVRTSFVLFDANAV